MNREEITLLGFEIVAFAGDARSRLMEALAAAQKGDYAKAEELVEAANACIVEAHHAQTSLLQKEAAGEHYKTCLLFTHAQDTLMTIMSEVNLTEKMIILFLKT